MHYSLIFVPYELKEWRGIGHEGFENSGSVWVTHREIFSKSYSINPKSDCMYHFRLIWIQKDIHFDHNQSEDGKYNLISG